MHKCGAINPVDGEKFCILVKDKEGNLLNHIHIIEDAPLSLILRRKWFGAELTHPAFDSIEISRLGDST